MTSYNTSIILSEQYNVYYNNINNTQEGAILHCEIFDTFCVFCLQSNILNAEFFFILWSLLLLGKCFHNLFKRLSIFSVKKANHLV